MNGRWKIVASGAMVGLAAWWMARLAVWWIIRDLFR